MANKRQERAYLEWFLRESGIDWRSIEDTEEPDFYVVLNDKRIGVEITNVYCETEPGRKGSKAKEQEAHRRQWLGILQRSYYESAGIPIWVQILLPSPESYRWVEDKILLKALSCASKRLAVWEQERCCVETKPGTAKLHVTRLPDGTTTRPEWSFQNNEFGIVSSITEDHIRSAIDKKTPKARKYRENCKEVWLLIVADSSCQSGMLQYTPRDLNLENSGFDAIWFSEHLHTVHRLLG